MNLKRWLIAGAVLALVASACASDEPAAAELGSAERPIQVIFVPSTDTEVIVSGGQIMADALKEATGYEYTVTVPTSYAAALEGMCAAPEDTMGFIPGLGYVLASNLCGVDVAFKAVRFGLPVYYAQIVVRRDSGIETMADLDGKTWGYGDVGSTSGYMVPLLMMSEAGVSPSDEVQTGGHGNSALAVYRGDVDFGTTFFSPPLRPDALGSWSEGDDPDIPEPYLSQCAVDEEGRRIYCGTAEDDRYRVLDARSSAREEAPDIVQQVKILEISAAIPNDTLSFGPSFPAALRAEIETALLAFAETDAWGESIGHPDFYDWSSIAVASDAEYDNLRTIVDLAGIDMDNIGS